MDDTATPRLPRLGEPAPDFTAVTTHGRLGLADFRGSWLILFSHPADFTPVCTTEFIGFSRIAPALAERGVKLLGLSVDSVYSHIAWVRLIEEKFGVKVPFPVIADLDQAVARAYGMIMPGESSTAATRAVFVIDPEGVLRAMIYYPLSTGRNMDEILRLVDGLQATDAHGVATPADWKPGEPVIVPPPATDEEAAARLASGEYDCTDWFFCKKAL